MFDVCLQGVTDRPFSSRKTLPTVLVVLPVRVAAPIQINHRTESKSSEHEQNLTGRDTVKTARSRVDRRDGTAALLSIRYR